MPKERVVDIVEQLTLPILEAHELELVDVEYKKEGGSWFLRVFIDKPGGVDIDDCSKVSEQLSDRLDEVDPIPTAYFLEVSSPGAERPLKKPADFERAVGSYVHVSLYQPLDGQKAFEGVLLSYGADGAELEVREKGVRKHVHIPVDAVASARLAIEF
ncbi:ribosome maturation factor RimP [Alicyclobacillus sp. ALC3]|uniref:ribosome maturation factor RimP n=1 Tax=Alicyclobacillus sp. ALC3 TaxID=2796143 RepID=UPI002378D553|nr:ribosome maturation factor RimP [Alicyclobacillus sp. ALC3]WDL97345.1 ribosome maturation factor RimP [Alicyclobacillus sp. ALC3]